MPRRPTNPTPPKHAPQLPRTERALSLADQTERTLRDAIAGRFFGEDRLPTLVELAEQLGVSRETVRLASERLEREGLLVKHRRRGTFARATKPIPGLQPAASNTIGYLTADYSRRGGIAEAVTRGQSGSMLEGALNEASRQGFQLLVRSATALELRPVFEEMTRSTRLCGVVLASVAEQKFVHRLGATKLPVLLVDHDLNLPKLSSLRTDSMGAVKLAVAHLAALSHTRIACAYWNQADLNPWFLRGYRESMRAQGLRSRRAWELPVELTPDGATRCITQLLDLSPRPTAIIAFNNSFASFLLDAARRMELKVPEMLSIFGGGGAEVVGLTCAQLNWHQLGRDAIRMLLAWKEPEPPKRVLVSYQPQPGQTTGSIA